MDQPGQQLELNGAQRAELADLLIGNKQEVERRWVARVSTELGRTQMSETELRNSIPDYLVALAQGLRLDTHGAMAERGSEAWAAVAREHALTRIRLGFDVDEVVREFLLLRVVILEVLGEESRLTVGQTERVNQLIGGALRTCVKSYVDHRDYETRKQQAQHIGFITHELRNPLSTAMAAAGQVRKLAAQGKDASRALELLERNQKRLRTMIDDTLLAQRFEVGAVKSSPTEIRLGEILDAAVKAAEEAGRRKAVDLELDFDPEILLRVDPELATSAVRNLVDNAMKFTDTGRVSVRVDDAPTEVIIHVLDECHGISQEELRVLFEPFKRGHSGKPGTGLGLAIARRAVEAHGKTIHASSDGEHGCHFWFALPKASH